MNFPAAVKTIVPSIGILPAPAILKNVQEQHLSSTENIPVRIGPVFFSGRSPFKIRVMILTCFAITENEEAASGSYITYVGYKKEGELQYDFDEMIPSLTTDEAVKTHSRACNFFDRSSLFRKTA